MKQELPSLNEPYVGLSHQPEEKPAVGQIISAFKGLVLGVARNAEVEFEMHGDLYAVRFSYTGGRSPHWDRAFPIRTATSLLYKGGVDYFEAEQMPEPEDYPIESVYIYLGENELARHTQAFHPPLYQPTSNLIEVDSSIKSRREKQGHGFSTGLFAAAEDAARKIMRTFPQDFNGKKVVLRACDISEYKGKSTGWTGAQAERLGYTNDPKKDHRENYSGESRVCRVWEKEVDNEVG